MYCKQIKQDGDTKWLPAKSWAAWRDHFGSKGTIATYMAGCWLRVIYRREFMARRLMRWPLVLRDCVDLQMKSQHDVYGVPRTITHDKNKIGIKLQIWKENGYLNTEVLNLSTKHTNDVIILIVPHKSNEAEEAAMKPKIVLGLAATSNPIWGQTQPQEHWAFSLKNRALPWLPRRNIPSLPLIGSNV